MVHGLARLKFAPMMLAALALGGCFSYRAGRVQTAAAEPLPADAWPARDIEAVRPLHAATPQQIFRYELEPGVKLEDVNPDYAPFVQEKPECIVTHCELNGLGLLRHVLRDTDEAETLLDQCLYGFTPNAWFLTSHVVNNARFQKRLARARNGEIGQDNLLKFFAPGLRSASTRWLIALEEGMAMRLPHKVADDPSSIPGIVIHFTAMVGTEYEDAVINELRDRGWVVLGISSEAYIQPPKRDVHAQRLAELDAQRNELTEELTKAFTAKFDVRDAAERAQLDSRIKALQKALGEVIRESVLLDRGSFQVCDESRVEPVAIGIAAAVDEQLAEHAYAAESALRYVHEQFPQLRAKPVVVIGFSAGSLAAPAAAVRLGDAVSAVVLIGAGANAFEIARRGELTDGGIYVRCEDQEVPAYMLDQLSDAYLAHSRLDPYHTAAQLRNKRVLLVRATHDAWVPASTGKLLRKRLGDPDCLTHLGGHRTLFFFLPSQADRIANWMAKAVEKEAALE